MCSSKKTMPDDHYDSPPQFSLKGLFKAIFFCCALLGLLSLLKTSLCEPREFSRRTQCGYNLRTIGIALMEYHDDFGCFPAPSVVDGAGKPMHSWRVAIAPYLDAPLCEDFRRQYDFKQPWNSRSNLKAAHVLDHAQNPFECLSANQPRGAALTNYVMIVGEKTAWHAGRPTSIDEITDGSGETILVVEIANSDILWTEPRDLNFADMSFAINSQSKSGISSGHTHEGRRPAAVLFADGSVKFLDETTQPAQLKAMLTSASGD